MIATMIVPCVAHPFPFEQIVEVSFLWLASGFPLAISLVLAKTLRSNNSSIILLVSTIAYGIWYICVLPTVFFKYLGALALLFVGVLALPVMIPAWIAALWLNSYYVKKTPDPGTAIRPGALYWVIFVSFSTVFFFVLLRGR